MARVVQSSWVLHPTYVMHLLCRLLPFLFLHTRILPYATSRMDCYALCVVSQSFVMAVSAFVLVIRLIGLNL